VAATIALLRSVNVGGRKLVMADLRTVMTDLGFSDARTLLASGNLVFDAGARTGADLEALIGEAVQSSLGLRVDVFVRSAEVWRGIIAANPFPEAASSDPAHLVVMALKAAPEAWAVERLRGAIVGRETVHLRGREAYMVYPDGIGESRLTAAVIERNLGVVGTARNWNTVMKLADLAGA
jgi:uncharacterized protein (DUF1697 family)